MAQVIIFADTSRPGIWLRGIGPYSLATHIRQYGYTVEVIDFISGFGYDDFSKLIEKFCGPETQMVGVSSTWITADRWSTDIKNTFGEGDQAPLFFDKDRHSTYYDSFSWALTTKTHQRFFDKIRKHAPNAKLIVGGVRAIDFAEHGFDKVMLGYSENQIIDLLDKRRIITETIINHDIKGEIGDFDFGSSKTMFTPSDFLLEDETLPIEIGRGCIFKCKYCSFPLIGKKKLSYLKEAESLKTELLFNWEHFRIRRYIIIDDTFNDSLDKLRYLADIIDTLPFRPQFWCFARLDLITINREQIELLHRIGVKEVQFGIESFNPASAKAVGKGLGPDIKKDTLYAIKEYWKDDVRTKCSFIIGLPHETSETIQTHYEWLLKPDCPVDAAGINPLFLSQPDKYQSYRWNSYFDLHYEEYGYYFENPTHHFDWKKKDNTDIDSFVKAYSLYKHWTPLLGKNGRPISEQFYHANTKKLGLTFEELLDDEKFIHAKYHIDWKSLYFDQVKHLYVERKLNC